MKLHKRNLFEIETKALSMGLGGENIKDEKLCKSICTNLREACIKRNVPLLHDILSLYILEVKLLGIRDMTYCEDSGILIKYEPREKNLNFALEDGSSNNIKINKLDDLKPFFNVFDTKDPNFLFTTCAIYSNGWYQNP